VIRPQPGWPTAHRIPSSLQALVDLLLIDGEGFLPVEVPDYLGDILPIERITLLCLEAFLFELVLERADGYQGIAPYDITLTFSRGRRDGLDDQVWPTVSHGRAGLRRRLGP